MVLAEVELTSEDQKFTLLPGIVKEVSTDFRYCNSELAKNPWKNWGKEEKEKTFTVELTQSEMHEVHSSLESYIPHGVLLDLRNTPDLDNKEERVQEMQKICDDLEKFQEKFWTEN